VIGLYAIAQGAPPDAAGAFGESLRVIAHSGMELVCGDLPDQLSPEALRAYEAAVRRIADRSEACLPARFGAAAGSEAVLQQLVEARAPALLEALALVRGREQMTLRVLGDQQPSPVAGGPGTRYLEERRRAAKVPELDPLRAALSSLIRAEQVEPHAQPGLLASVYHLIDRGNAEGYRQRVQSSPLEGVRVTVSGPWPAWSFAPELSP
jgi:Gas vesicle synthesis protein GvpL/GvpF